MKHRQIQKSAADPRRGALTVEFALVAPIIFLMFFGGLELTRLNIIRHTAANASYEAARAAIVTNDTASRVQKAQQKALWILRSAGATTNSTVTIDDSADRVTATVRVPVADNSWGLGRFSGSLVIIRTCTLSRER